MDPEPALPDMVRSAAALVAERARHVHVDHRRLVEFASTLPREPIANPSLTPDDLPSDDPHDIVAWVFTVHAVNFGSGFFPVLRKRPGLSGSKTIFAALRERFRSRGPLTPAELSEATPRWCAEIFEQDPDGPAAPLLGWFADSWRQLGAAVETRWAGDLGAIVEDAAGSAARLASLLASIPGWNDVSHHGELEVPLFKRAQIVPAHLAMAFGGRGPGSFHDLDRLTIFADNLVPHVLRIDGVLRFDAALVDRIEREELLTAGSVEEVEIRAVGVHVAELLVEELRRTGPASAMGVDQVLWNRGAQARYKARPRHRARSRAY